MNKRENERIISVSFTLVPRDSATSPGPLAEVDLVILEAQISSFFGKTTDSSRNQRGWVTISVAPMVHHGNEEVGQFYDEVVDEARRMGFEIAIAWAKPTP